MTHRNDATSRVLDRWRLLAEQRLEHLTELFESGRWRRYHSEVTFLENIREAKDAVQTWRDLASPKPVAPRAAPTPKPRPAPPIQLRKIGQAAMMAPIELPAATEAAVVPMETRAAAVIDLAEFERALEAPALDLSEIEQRYPLLRNAL
jgi:uncharacterized repeat protein (TIGR03809 family)